MHAKSKGTKCSPEHEEESAKVYIAHADRTSCGHGAAENYVDPCIENSNILDAAAAEDGMQNGQSITDLLQRNRVNDDDQNGDGKCSISTCILNLLNLSN